MELVCDRMAESLPERDIQDVSFQKLQLERISTGSTSFDIMLGGGLPVSSITDVYGAAGTGKTQFAFQNAIMTCAKRGNVNSPSVAFVDCTGSFRPERLVEIIEGRSLDAKTILNGIYSISVRRVKEQTQVVQRIGSEAFLSRCRLVIVDDATSNFVIDFSEDEVAARQTALAIHLRDLAYLAGKKGISVLLTNSARSRGDKGEGETTGDVIAQYALYRMQFERIDRNRFATLMQPELGKPRIRFEIENSGIL
jgi:RecA/RadA recombinase